MTHRLIIHARRHPVTNRHHARQVLDVCCESLVEHTPRAVIVQTLALTLSIKRDTVADALVLLVQLGYLVRHGTDARGSGLYTLADMADVPAARAHDDREDLGENTTAA